ncbi:hypothetical protein M407DRAFT_246673 [Tulasnella calospora MUT 4182]|uniref:SH3 domain-containing protein n=1 Tax=Tulasnella calospora MUT 4182 TaxID=1051891 RepID=A0A0C3PSJ3_9AGAM|nr:hypothetical protein M407DRAFT_246673 [Tulasnella calospora MUT 4182]
MAANGGNGNDAHHQSQQQAAGGMAAASTESQDTNADGTLEETFFVRALYDYQSTDFSALPFFRGAFIEVLSQLPSGWWDGLLGDQRGWFPSNYVRPVTEAELNAVETALAITGYPPSPDLQPQTAAVEQQGDLS